MKSVKNIVILGSTGSIGISALDIIDRQADRFQVVGLVAGGNVGKIGEQIRKYKPKIVALFDESAVKEVRRTCSLKGVKILAGIDGIIEAATIPESDFVVSAIVGAAGLLPTISAVNAGKDIGLANKEALVMAGEIVMEAARKKKVKIIPVDSEHSAIYQSLSGAPSKSVKKLILTASGGAFRNLPKDEMENIKPEEALKHPNWNMGNKITIDSSTMMNKGLEVIEAKWLFDMDPDNIEVLIHPQSIIHSMVEFVDTSIIGQLGLPDMRVPISYALNLGERVSSSLGSVDFSRIKSLTFESPDFDKFPCLTYAYEAIRKGGSVPAVLNAANEVAVHSFINGEIGFTGIARTVKEVIDLHSRYTIKNISDALKADQWGRSAARERISEIKNN